MTERGGEQRGRAAFARYWAASTASAAGTAVTAVALPVIVGQTLRATPLRSAS